MQQTLRITEIFYPLQGEARTAGLPTIFVRLTGCPLRYRYCDTAYTFSGGDVVSLDTILEWVATYKPRYICVTGGEPLAQSNCISLLERLCNAGYEVSLETSGVLDVSRVGPRVSKVLDLKTPGSGEVERNRYRNIPLLTDNDQVKLVVCPREDYDWAVSKLIEYHLDQRAGEVLLSPGHHQVSARELADWIVADNLPVCLQLQLHKILWNDGPNHQDEESIMNQKKAVILLPGGLDSTTVAAIAEANGYACYTMGFDYGQRHRAGLQAAERVARQLGAIEHRVIGLDLNGMGGSALIDESIAVPESPSEGIPVTYVPVRNMVFLSLALGWAEVLDVRDIFIGVNAADYSGYSDYRPELVETFERMANLATKADMEGNSFRIQAPLQYLFKTQIIQAGAARGVDYGLTVSCHQTDEQGRAYGKRDSCRLRTDGFAAAGISDLTPYF